MGLAYVKNTQNSQKDGNTSERLNTQTSGQGEVGSEPTITAKSISPLSKLPAKFKVLDDEGDSADEEEIFLKNQASRIGKMMHLDSRKIRRTLYEVTE